MAPVPEYHWYCAGMELPSSGKTCLYTKVSERSLTDVNSLPEWGERLGHFGVESGAAERYLAALERMDLEEAYRHLSESQRWLN